MWKTSDSKMHGVSEIGPNVPAFLIKLWKLVNSPETDELICWSESGMSFIINNPAQFSRELLSLYYKHNNMASFIRQLNMYGFHKIVSDGGGLKSDNLKNKYKDCMEFAHQCFIKDHPYLLENIKRKLPNAKSGSISNEQITNTNLKNGTQSEILAKVLSDVNNLKGKQESWDAKLASMKRENEALWRELAIFRQKHLKQEQIINRLIHFIVTMVQPSRNVPLRRRYPLMLNDIQRVKKITKLSGADAANINQGSPTGPIIHEIDGADVLLGSPEQLEVSTAEEYISPELSDASSKLLEVEGTEPAPTTTKETKPENSFEVAENIPEDWLEIQLTEDNMIDPLTPVDPAKVNPAVAAATLKHLEETKKMTAPVSITIPSVTTSTESGKKNVTEKKVVYLSGLNDAEKSSKRKTKKPLVLKLDKGNNKSLLSSDDVSSSSDSLLSLVSKKAETRTKSTTVGVKRKLSKTPKTVSSSRKKTKKVDTKTFVPELDVDQLDFLLTGNKSDDDLAKSGGADKQDKTSDQSFLKLQSLYNGTISEDQLSLTPTECSLDGDLTNETKNTDNRDKPTSPGILDVKDLTSKEETQTTDDVLNFEPDSMAIVCQQPSTADSLTPDLGSHVDSVQGEIDYLKEMLKGEGYNFDPNSLPWLLNEDPLSYGVLPAVDDEGNEKKNEDGGVSGNELMTYGSPNLMDLVDLIGSNSSNQDWANVLSPTSPLITDLSTPAPSPSSFSFPSPGKRRKT